ncbi:MAG: transglycosylase domain-containing protein [Candidatus Saccharimonadales bacterium]
MTKKSSKSRKLSVYSNLSHTHKTRKDLKSRKKAEYLASLPKNPIKRFFYRLNPKHLAEFWFSKHGAILALKILGVSILIVSLVIGTMFIIFRKDLEMLKPGELSKRVQSTVVTYLDRNGKVLWADKGEGNYKLVVESDELSDYLKKATIAIEDKSFYQHNGVSASGLFRAVINNLSGGSTQGGSTLTQQLVKQVFFADEAQQRGLTGVPRKIKEMFLAVEVERMYNKEQILTMYLNESPYGGRRNGAESGAQTYFGKTAKDLNIAEAALLAAIPQNPSVYNPYNIAGHEGLIARQHKVINSMVEQRYITQEEADEAKKYPILDHITPEADQYAGIKAPHFVQMVKSELEAELGKATVGKGGLIVKTTLDIRVQNKLEEAIDDMFKSNTPNWAGFSNSAATVEDVKTGQIIALMGSRDFNYPGYGQDNAAIAYIQPGSSIKPLVYAELFEKKGDGMINYGSGSILKDEKIDEIYGATLNNADRTFKGNLTIRSALATSRNIPAVKAMYISTVEKTLETIRNLGAKSYCTQGDEVTVGLAAAIGGCGVKQVDLVNAYSSIAREGYHKPQSIILEIKNNSGEVLKKWSDPASEKIIDKQSAYIVSDILTDDNARIPLDGYHAIGMYIEGVQTATKTGTSDRGGAAKDIWMVSYSPVLAMGVWLGNSDASTLLSGTSQIPGPIIDKVMAYAHKEVYAKEKKWKSGDWFTKPSGIQTIGKEVYPSWWNKNQGQTKAKLIFDRVSKKKATSLTPEAAKIEIEVIKIIDPVTKKPSYIAPDGYDGNKNDDAHKASDKKPSASVNDVVDNGDGTYSVTVSTSQGTFAIKTVQIIIDGVTVKTYSSGGSYTYTGDLSSSKKSVHVLVTDKGYYTAQSSAVEIPAVDPLEQND